MTLYFNIYISLKCQESMENCGKMFLNILCLIVFNIYNKGLKADFRPRGEKN